MTATLLEALAQTALDLLVGFAGLTVFCVLFITVMWIWHRVDERQRKRWQEACESHQGIRPPIDFSGEIRVRDKTRRGPATEHHGRKRVGL